MVLRRPGSANIPAERHRWRWQPREDSEGPSVEHVCSTPFCKVVLLVVLMTTQEVVVLKRVTLTEVEVGAVLLLV